MLPTVFANLFRPHHPGSANRSDQEAIKNISRHNEFIWQGRSDHGSLTRSRAHIASVRASHEEFTGDQGTSGDATIVPIVFNSPSSPMTGAAGYVCGVQQTFGSAAKLPMHTLTIRFDAPPSDTTIVRVARASVDNALKARLVPPEYAGALLTALTKDLLGLREALKASQTRNASERAHTNAGRQGPITFSAAYRLVPGGVCGASDRHSVALPVMRRLARPGHGDLVAPAVDFELAARAYVAMPELEMDLRAHRLTPDSAARAARIHSADPSVHALFDPAGNAEQLVADFIATATVHCKRERAARLAIESRGLVGSKALSVAHRPPNSFDLYHDDPTERVDSQSPLARLMRNAVANWRPSKDAQTNAYRIALIMHEYAHLSRVRQEALPQPDIERTRF